MERYDFTTTFEEYEDSRGDWVRYEDVESLENELGWATKRIDELEDELRDREVEIERLNEMLELLGGDE
jgi:predicted  nucleic acid-binding Zn-ribbon protein